MKRPPVDELEIIDEHLHSPQKVSPSGAASILLQSGAGAWKLGAFSADIIAAGAEKLPFDLHWADLDNPDTNAQYEIVFYYGSADIEACRCTFTRFNTTVRSAPAHLQSVIFPPGSRVRAKMMDSVGSSKCSVKVWYHNYT